VALSNALSVGSIVDGSHPLICPRNTIGGSTRQEGTLGVSKVCKSFLGYFSSISTLAQTEAPTLSCDPSVVVEKICSSRSMIILKSYICTYDACEYSAAVQQIYVRTAQLTPGQCHFNLALYPYEVRARYSIAPGQLFSTLLTLHAGWPALLTSDRKARP
jgi:hypothetical protein